MKLLVKNVHGALVMVDTDKCERLYVVPRMYLYDANVKAVGDTETGYFDSLQLAFFAVIIGKNPRYYWMSALEALQEVFAAQNNADPMADIGYVIKIERSEELVEMFAETPRRWTKPEGK